LPNLVLGILSGTGVPPIVLPPVSGYKLWLDGSDTSTITASGGDVSQWSDKSGFDRHFTQATGANQPKTGTRTINSKNVLDFDGTNDQLVCPSSTTLFQYLQDGAGSTIFIVGIVDNNAGQKAFFANCDFASSDVGFIAAVSDTETTRYAVVNGGGVAINVSNVNTLTPGSPFYLSTKVDPANATPADRLKESLNAGSFNGSNASSGGVSGASSSDAKIGDLSSNAWPYDGAIGEIIFYEGILSAGDITSVQSYLATKWGI
jgi:hypothetical protein